MIVAVAALFLTYTQIQDTRRIERLTWQPDLRVSLGQNKDIGFYVALHNQGPGAAKIKWFRVYYDGVLMETWRDVFDQMDHLPERPFSEETGYRFRIPTPGYVLHAKTELDDPFFMLRDKIDPWAEELHRTRHRLGYAYCYCSLLGTCREVKRGRTEDLHQTIIEDLKDTDLDCEFEKNYRQFFRSPG